MYNLPISDVLIVYVHIMYIYSHQVIHTYRIHLLWVEYGNKRNSIFISKCIAKSISVFNLFFSFQCIIPISWIVFVVILWIIYTFFAHLFTCNWFVLGRDLRCLRNTIHMNLLLTYLLHNFLWLASASLQVRSTFLLFFSSIFFLSLYHFLFYFLSLLYNVLPFFIFFLFYTCVLSLYFSFSICLYLILIYELLLDMYLYIYL